MIKKNFHCISSKSLCSWWPTTVATCYPSRVAEHPKSKPSRGFHRPDGSPCRNRNFQPLDLLIILIILTLFPNMYLLTRRDIWCDASDRGGPSDRAGHALEGTHRLSHGKKIRDRERESGNREWNVSLLTSCCWNNFEDSEVLLEVVGMMGESKL